MGKHYEKQIKFACKKMLDFADIHWNAIKTLKHHLLYIRLEKLLKFYNM